MIKGEKCTEILPPSVCQRKQNLDRGEWRVVAAVLCYCLGGYRGGWWGGRRVVTMGSGQEWRRPSSSKKQLHSFSLTLVKPLFFFF